MVQNDGDFKEYLVVDGVWRIESWNGIERENKRKRRIVKLYRIYNIAFCTFNRKTTTKHSLNHF